MFVSCLQVTFMEHIFLLIVHIMAINAKSILPKQCFVIVNCNWPRYSVIQFVKIILLLIVTVIFTCNDIWGWRGDAMAPLCGCSVYASDVAHSRSSRWSEELNVCSGVFKIRGNIVYSLQYINICLLPCCCCSVLVHVRCEGWSLWYLSHPSSAVIGQLDKKGQWQEGYFTQSWTFCNSWCSWCVILLAFVA